MGDKQDRVVLAQHVQGHPHMHPRAERQAALVARAKGPGRHRVEVNADAYQSSTYPSSVTPVLPTIFQRFPQSQQQHLASLVADLIHSARTHGQTKQGEPS
jgi:hypothetical protein